MAEERSAGQQDQERQGASAPSRRGDSLINLMDIEHGTRVNLPDDALGEVVANPRDGSWIIVKYIESPSDSSKVGQEEPIFAEDVLGVAE